MVPDFESSLWVVPVARCLRHVGGTYLQLCALTGTVYVYVHCTYTVPVGTWSSVYLHVDRRESDIACLETGVNHGGVAAQAQKHLDTELHKVAT